MDLQAQAIILEALEETTTRYDLGVLAEEGIQDESRLDKHAFWTIDPLDGTQYFIDGVPGYATSIALVSREGRPIVGVVYDPVSGDLYEAVLGRGVRRNGQLIARPDAQEPGIMPRVWFADRSLPSYPYFEGVQAHFEVRYLGGAVLNALGVLSEPGSVYAKAPKAARSGCAIWDLAAVALMVEEQGGGVMAFDGSTLNLNPPGSVFFNDTGFALSGAQVDKAQLALRCEAILASAPPA